MKPRIVMIGVIALAILFSTSCHHTVMLKAPPGQVKKITGSKSAKPYAPGQQKKKRNR